MKRFISIALCVILCLSAVCAFAGCNKDKKGGESLAVEIKKTVDEAKKEVTDAGCIPVIVTVCEEGFDNGAVLSIGKFMDGAKEGDYVTICVNDTSIKETVEALPVAPRMLTKDSFETKILANAGDNETKLKVNYTAVGDNYVLDPGASGKDITDLAEAITATGYTAADMYNDYVAVGIVPTATEAMKADVLSADNATLTEVNGSYTVSNYTGTSRNVVVPSEIDSKPITSVGASTFLSPVNALTVEEGVEILESGVIAKAYGLIDVNLADSVINIGKNAFINPLFTTVEGDYTMFAGNIALSYNGSETDITIPEDIKYLAPEIFKDKKALTSVTFNEGLVSIGTAAFSGCEALANVTFPESLLYIGDNAFTRARAFTEIKLPANVKVVGNEAFLDCSSVSSLELNDGLKKIGNFAFKYCLFSEQKTLNATLEIPNSVEYLGNYAFMNANIVDVKGGEGLTYVGRRPFEETDWFINFAAGEEFGIFNGFLIKYALPDDFDGNVVVPDGVKGLSGAFEGITKIETVKINDGCISIADSEFLSNSNLTDVTIPASVTVIGESILDIAKVSAITVHCEAGSAAEAYASKNLFKTDNNM
ncbi:MAG: leucine-rich repeat protein [Clostridia bacterium]|nr:leucine-rich repeat protein [Clostridia bacterium]